MNDPKESATWRCGRTFLPSKELQASRSAGWRPREWGEVRAVRAQAVPSASRPSSEHTALPWLVGLFFTLCALESKGGGDLPRNGLNF
jgi:hypothetical protein